MDYNKPTEEELRDIDIHELLPQQEPFVMIDTLVSFDVKRTVSETIVSKDNMFVEDNHLTSSGLIENIAQTCAARIGYINKYINKKGIQIGLIGAIRNLEIIKLPEVNQRILTTVDIEDEVFGMILAKANIACNGEDIVTTEIKIVVKG